jgi:hypothetical protein
MYSIVQCLFHDQIHKALVSGKKYIPTVDTIYTIIFRYIFFTRNKCLWSNRLCSLSTLWLFHILQTTEVYSAWLKTDSDTTAHLKFRNRYIIDFFFLLFIAKILKRFLKWCDTTRQYFNGQNENFQEK